MGSDEILIGQRNPRPEKPREARRLEGRSSEGANANEGR
jgi:hypothetical protein